MCGRYAIYESMDDYLRQLALDLVVINRCAPAAHFKWYPVGKQIGNARNEGLELIESLKLQLLE